MERKKHVKPDDKKKTIFSAIFEPGFNSQTLKIPPGVVPEGRQEAILSSEGRRWVVELYEYSKNQVFFSNGWEQFAQDHHLHQRHFLHFEYHHQQNIFEVGIFHKNGFKRVYSNQQEQPTSKRSMNQLKTQYHHNTPAIKKMVKEKHGKPDDNPKASFTAIFEPGFNSQTLKIPVAGLLPEGTHQSILSSLCREDQDWIIDLYEFSKNEVFFSNGWEQFVSDHHLHQHDFILFEHGGENIFKVRIFQQNGLEKLYSNIQQQQQQQQEEEPTSKRSKNMQLIQTFSSHHSIPGKEKDDDKVERKTKPFSSQNPFFSRLMKHYNVNVSHTLPIPKSMVNAIFPENRREATIRNKEGRIWVVKKSNAYRGQTFLLPRGWKRFVLDNSLKVGDLCIFELVAQGKLQVHIL